MSDASKNVDVNLRVVGSKVGVDVDQELRKVTATQSEAEPVVKRSISLTHEQRMAVRLLGHELGLGRGLIHGFFSVTVGAIAASAFAFRSIKEAISGMGDAVKPFSNAASSIQAQHDAIQNVAKSFKSFEADIAKAVRGEETLKQKIDAAVDSLREQTQAQVAQTDKQAVAQLAKINLLETTGRISKGQAEVLRGDVQNQAEERKRQLQDTAAQKTQQMREQELEDAKKLLVLQMQIAQVLESQVETMEKRGVQGKARLDESQKMADEAKANQESTSEWRRTWQDLATNRAPDWTQHGAAAWALAGPANLYAWATRKVGALGGSAMDWIGSEDAANVAKWSTQRRVITAREAADRAEDRRQKASRNLQEAEGRATGTAGEVGDLVRTLPHMRDKTNRDIRARFISAMLDQQKLTDESTLKMAQLFFEELQKTRQRIDQINKLQKAAGTRNGLHPGTER